MRKPLTPECISCDDYRDTCGDGKKCCMASLDKYGVCMGGLGGAALGTDKAKEDGQKTSLKCKYCGGVYDADMEHYSCIVCGSESCTDCGGRCGCEDPEDFDSLVEEVKRDPVAWSAYIENDIRRQVAEQVTDACGRNGVDVKDLAKTLEISKVQARRLLHKEAGGTLKLNTIIRAAVVLGSRIDMSISVGKEDKGGGVMEERKEAFRALIILALTKHPDWVDAAIGAVMEGTRAAHETLRGENGQANWAVTAALILLDTDDDGLGVRSKEIICEHLEGIKRRSPLEQKMLDRFKVESGE